MSLKSTLFILLLCTGLLSAGLFAQSAPGAGVLVEALPLLSASRDQVTQLSNFELSNHPADYYKILYTTPDIEGILDTASGLLIVPRRGDIDMSIAVYQRSTPQSGADVPSDLSASAPVRFSSVLAGQGMIVLTPDYLGMGEARGFHPYLDRESEARVAVDMLYAVEAFLSGEGISRNEQLFIAGYSQGGHAGMALHRELQENYQEDWSVTQSILMSGPYDLTLFEELFLDVDAEYPSLALPAFMLLGLQEAEGGLTGSLEAAFAPPYLSIVEQFRSEAWAGGSITLDSIETLLVAEMQSAEGGLFPARMLRETYRQEVAADENHPLRAALRDNSLLDWAPQTPLGMLYCENDEIVVAQHALNADSVFMARGGQSRITNLGLDLNHIACGSQAIGAVRDIFNSLRADWGRFIFGTLTHDGVERNYFTYLPVGYDGTETLPLVINLHGLGSSSGQQAIISRLNPVADTARFIMVIPQALSSPAGPAWNDRLDPNGADDVGFLSRLIDRTATEYNIDPARVYAAGFSNGGAMSHLLACQLPDRIAAVASVAGPVLEPVFENNCQLERPVPLLHMHGTSDPVAPFEGGGMPIPGFTTPVVNDYIQFWVDQNGCEAEPMVEMAPDLNIADSSTAEIRRYNNCESDSEVWYYIIENGDHTWPGGPPILPPFDQILGTTVNRDIDGSTEIWNFFNRHTHPDPAPVAQLLDLTLEHQDSTRKYLLYVPANYDGSEAWPLVVNMHGQGVSRYGQVLESQMNPVADTAHFMVAYPEATMAPFITGGMAPVWNTGRDSERPDDLAFVDQLIKTLIQDWNIDNSRVYATGKSAGGVMSYFLACQYPERVAAIASVSGVPVSFNDWTCTADRPIPVLHIHGTADLITPINGGPGVDPSISFPPLREVLQLWLDNNDCSADSTLTALPDLDPNDGSTVERRQFQSCDSYTGVDGVERTAELWYYQIDGGGHTWPGGPDEQIPPGFEQFFGNINRDINASSEIWNFFNRFNLQTTALSTLSPSELDLQVFPNPFSTQLTFTFELPEAAPVQLSVFNQLGQEIGKLVEARLDKGAHRIDWNTTARQLPAGMYYYRLRVGDRLVSRPVVLGRVD